MTRVQTDRDASIALNNAEWCAAVWRSHGLLVEQAHGMWFTTSTPPPLYPNVVTVDPSEAPEAQARFVVELARCPRRFAVKDSFNRLPLDARHFTRMFQASWVWRGASPPPSSSSSRWVRVTEPHDLDQWAGAWRRGDDSLADVFRPRLLADPRAIFMGQVDPTGSFVGGAVGYEAAGLLGLTNIFGSSEGLLAAVLDQRPGAQLCGYERGAALEAAQLQGFQRLGSLSVWSRQASTTS